MSNDPAVYVELQKLADHHPGLSKFFTDFLNSASALFEDVTGVELDLPPPSGDSFEVAFLGNRIEFRFSSALTSDGSPVGVVKCFTWEHPSYPKPSEVVRFTFSREGLITDVKQDHFHNALRIDNGSHAVFLLAYCLRHAMSAATDGASSE